MPMTPAEAATTKAALPLDQTALVGTLIRPDNRIALVRHPGGRIERLSVGDRLNGGTVTAIGEGELHLATAGKAVVYRLPAS